MADGGLAAGGRLEGELGLRDAGRGPAGRDAELRHRGLRARRDYRLGYGLTVAQGGAMHFELGTDANRRESPSQGTAENGVGSQLTARW